MKLWIARNPDDSLWLHEEKPSLVFDDELRRWYYESGNSLELYNESLFPEVTFENSPQQVELKLISNDKDTK
jgi:hypothetical protein